jgi:hypothetical protein
MAYLRSCLHACLVCKRPAKVELVGQFNNPLGHFCASHGKASLRRQVGIEQENWKLIQGAETPERAAELRKMLA